MRGVVIILWVIYQKRNDISTSYVSLESSQLDLSTALPGNALMMGNVLKCVADLGGRINNSNSGGRKASSAFMYGHFLKVPMFAVVVNK